MIRFAFGDRSSLRQRDAALSGQSFIPGAKDHPTDDGLSVGTPIARTFYRASHCEAEVWLVMNYRFPGP